MANQNKKLQPLISVVVPIYNSEKYLPKCIESIRKQTYKNIEIILVNDGSTDNSLKIAQKYAKKDHRIIVINQKNSGGIITRKNGIIKATGDYILTEDSDDWLEKNLIEKCVKEINNEKNVDIIKFGYIFEPSKKQKNLLNEGIVGKKTLENKEINQIIERLLYKTDCNQVWNEMVKKSLYNFNDKIFDTVAHKGEDLQINLQIYQKAKKVIFLKENLYHYLDNPNGITNNIDAEKVISNTRDIIYLNTIRKEIALRKFKHVNEDILINKTLSLLSGKIARILANDNDSKNKLLKIQNALEKELSVYLGGFDSSKLKQNPLKKLICINIVNGDYAKNLKYRPFCKILKVVGRL